MNKLTPMLRRSALAAGAGLLCLAMMLLAACSPTEKCPAASPDSATHYDLKAVVVSLEDGSNRVVMDHEEGPGLMGAMRMALAVPEEADRAKVKPGSRIRAKLILENNTMRVEGIEILGEGEVPAVEKEHSH